MAATKLSQLSGECTTWRNSLRKYREEFSELNDNLLQVSMQPADKDWLVELEHIKNQFYIQLINIHDLRHQIRAHDRRMAFEKAGNQGRVPTPMLSHHENLYDEVQYLENLLQEVKRKYNRLLRYKS